MGARMPVGRPSWVPGGLSEDRLGCQEARREAVLGAKRPVGRPSWAPGGPSGGCLGRQEARPEAVLAARTPRTSVLLTVRAKLSVLPTVLVQDGLPTGLLASKTASRRASWLPGRPPDGALAPKTASDGPSPADKYTCRQDHLPTSPPASQVSPGAKRHFDACTFLPLTPYCRDSLLDKTAARRT